MSSKETPKTGVRPKVPVTAPEADSSKDVPKETKKESKPAPKRDTKQTSSDTKKRPAPSVGNRVTSKQQAGSSDRSRPQIRRSSTDHSTVRQVCRKFMRNDCKLGNRCKYIHPNSSRSRSPVRAPRGGSPPRPVVCRDFIRSMCQRGSDCRFYHPPMEIGGGGVARVSWFTFCHDFLMGHCMNSHCSFFHINKQDEEMYRIRGEISPQLVEQAVQKSLVEDLALIGTRPCCKGFLRGLCTMPNCRLRHLSQREYEDEVFYALLEELEYLLGPPESRPFTPPPVSFYEPHDIMPDQMQPRMPGYPDDMMGMSEPGHPLPHPDYEPDNKRPRYNDQGYPGEEMRRWDEPMNYERDRSDLPLDADSLMQEILTLRNENMDLRRDAESKIEEIKEELSRVAQENSKLHADAVEMTVAHKVEMKNLTATNTTLVEDRLKAQEAVRHLERSNMELRQHLDAKVKGANMELENKLAKAKIEVDNARESFSKANAMLRKNEEERSRLVAEISDLKNKLRDMQGAASMKKDMQQYTNNSGFNKRETGYSRDMAGRGDGRTDWYEDNKRGQQREQRSGNNVWQQDMHAMDVLSQTKQHEMRAAKQNNGGNSHQGTQYGYSRRMGEQEQPAIRESHTNSRQQQHPWLPAMRAQGYNTAPNASTTTPLHTMMHDDPRGKPEPRGYSSSNNQQSSNRSHYAAAPWQYN